MAKEKKQEKVEVEVKEVAYEKRMKKLRKAKISATELIMFIKSLASMLQATIPITEAIKILEEQSDDKIMKEVLSLICLDIESGENLSRSMEKFPKIFPEIMISLVYAGESGGSLEMNLKYLADFLTKQHEVNKKVRSALIYPAIIIGLTCVQLTAMVFFIFPQLEELFESFPNVPAFTQNVIYASGVIRENWYFVLAGILVFVIILSQFFKTAKGKRTLHWFSINTPILKALFVSNILANFSRTLNILMKSGMDISKALEVTVKTVGNSIYAEKLSAIRENAREGKSISESLKEHPKFFSKSFVKMIEVGEKTETLEDNLEYLYKFYTEKVDDITNNITVFIEPLLLIMVGAIIGFLGITVMVPIYQLMSSINA
jgi:type IV pilus assembly protein PilC